MPSVTASSSANARLGCESPPSTEEPPPYAPGVVRGSDAWREVWWGNRKRTIAALESASTLAFVWRISERRDFGELAVRLLLDCARWDPHGPTGFRTNDEAGMPFAYHFSRTYTLVHPLLTEAERETCRAVMRARGREMFEHLAPRHLWRPYSSHANRAWHFLGEVGIAFHGEIPEAEEWVDFAVQVFANVYPVWSDDDGGWHEGSSYWRSYLSRFTWWADVQRAALGLDAYDLPFFSRAGDWALYVMPPGTRGGGFGDLSAGRTSEDARELMTTLALQARNPTWRWYVEQLGGPAAGPGWIGFLRRARRDVEPRPPTDLPTSRCFRGTGVAVLQSSLVDAADNVEVLFKSSPFGTQSHGYDAQNSLLLYAFGERLLIRSGKRDQHGSKHHREWMWETKSANSILVDGAGQVPHSAGSRGRITGFHTRPGLHWVEGEASEAYGGRLDGFRRGILFVEPDLIVVHDRLAAPAAALFEWRLHAPTPFDGTGPEWTVRNGGAACRIELLAPAGLEFEETDRFDPPPRERVQLVEHHLSARTIEPHTKTSFLTVLRPFRASQPPPARARFERGASVARLWAEVGSERLVLDVGEDGELRGALVDERGQPTLELDTGELRARWKASQR